MPNINTLKLPSKDKFQSPVLVAEDKVGPVEVLICRTEKGVNLSLFVRRDIIKELGEHLAGKASMRYAQSDNYIAVWVAKCDDEEIDTEWAFDGNPRDDDPVGQYVFKQLSMASFPIDNFKGAVSYRPFEGGLVAMVPLPRPKLKQKSSFIEPAFFTEQSRPLAKINHDGTGAPVWTLDCQQWLFAFLRDGRSLQVEAQRLGVSVDEAKTKYEALSERFPEEVAS